MQKNSKIFIIFVFIIASFFVFWLLFGNREVVGNSQNINETEQKNIILETQNNLIQANPLKEKFSQFFKEKNNDGNNINNGITQSIGTDLSNDFITALDQNKTSEEDFKTLLETKDFSSVAKNIKLEFNQPIDPRRVTILIDNTLQAKKIYLQNIITNINKEFVSFDSNVAEQVINDVFEKDDFGLLNNIIDKTDVVIKNLYAVGVPSDYLNNHIKLITAFENNKYLFYLIKNYKEDPFKLILAEEKIDELSQSSLLIINYFNNESDKYIK